MDVNDDCLFTIFTNLSVPELADIAGTCSRFKTIARDVFSGRHKSFYFKINVEDLQSSNDVAQLIKNRWHTAAILRNFGDMLRKLNVSFVETVDDADDHDDNEENRIVHNLITKYCGGGGGNLETLELANIYRGTDGFDVIATNKMLKVLRLDTIHIRFSDRVIERLPRLEKLQALTMLGPTIAITSDGLVALVSRLPGLEQLQIAPNSSNEMNERIKLTKKTYLRICEIYRDRDQKLVIRNYDDCVDEDDEEDLDDIPTIEPFAGENQELVQFIAHQCLYLRYPDNIYI